MKRTSMSAIRDLKTLHKTLSELQLKLYQSSFSFSHEKTRKEAAEEEGRMLRDKINKEIIKRTNEYIDNVYRDVPKPFIGEDACIPLKQTVAMIYAQKKESCVLAIRHIDKLGFRGGELVKKFFRNLTTEGEIEFISVFTRKKGILESSNDIAKTPKIGFAVFDSPGNVEKVKRALNLPVSGDPIFVDIKNEDNGIMVKVKVANFIKKCENEN